MQNDKPSESAPLRAGAVDPPGDAQHLCDGHVSGVPSADGKPGAHITWTAYSSREAPDVLTKRYLASFGSEGHAVVSGCDIWRFPPDKPTRVIDVCPVSADNPTLDSCPAPPAEAKSIIMISSMARSD
jgi:hypothetical protein